MAESISLTSSWIFSRDDSEMDTGTGSGSYADKIFRIPVPNISTFLGPMPLIFSKSTFVAGRGTAVHIPLMTSSLNMALMDLLSDSDCRFLYCCKLAFS